MKPKLLYIPYFPFLLPVFFVLHGYVDHAAYMSLRNCYGLLSGYLLVAAVVYALLYLFYRSAARAALALAALQAVSFFFGALHDLLTHHAVWLSGYGVTLPLLAILVAATLIWLKRTKRRLEPLVLFLNTLFLIYLLMDGTKAFLIAGRQKERLEVATPFSPYIQPCDTCSYPDVYLLLMDEYASTASLKKWCAYDNSGLDSFLQDKGFHIIAGSRSNYNFTAFSMASILNMSYLKGLGAGNLCSISDYAACSNLIRKSDVVRQLTFCGYDIVNYSIFDLEGKTSDVNLHLLPVKANLISGQTLWAHIRRDLGSKFYKIPVPIIKTQAYQIRDDNNQFIDGVVQQGSIPSRHPRFIYVHLEMPHFPHFYDRYGKLKEPKDLDRSLPSYLDYLPYTNGVIKKMVTAIQQNTHHSAVIILMGDHGVRYDVPGDPENIHDFRNLNAIFFPDRDYHLLYDTISGVNQFRVVFSNIFRQNIPLLKDSTVFLTDKTF